MKGAKPNLVLIEGALNRVPPAPSWLSKLAKKEWDRVLPGLVDREIMTESDMANLENYCVAQGRVRECEADMQRANSSEAKARIFRMQNASMATARQLSAELGLTPVSRSRPAMRDMFSEDGDDPLNIS